MQPEVQPAPRIADYELVRLIGSGSYGDVWLARGVTGVFRAVKIVWRARFTDPRPYAREFEGVTSFAAISLREPSQLALLHAGRNDEAGFFYYVMELADDADRGRDIEPGSYVPLTLKELRDRRERLPVAEVIALGVALARALGSLHASGLVHRDIKPSNIVLVGGVPKLADVGLVAAASEGLTFVGTEGFVPPEGPGAPAADVFSLGKVLYELATGLDRQDFPRLPPKLSDWPDRRALLELNEVLLRACEPVAANRFTNASTLLDELLLLQAGKSVRRLRNAERRTTRALRIAAVLALVAGVAGVGAWVERQRANEELELRRQVEAERDELARRNIYSGGLARAQRALETNHVGLARRILTELAPKSGEPDLRGFEWHALSREAHGDPAMVLREEGSAMQRLRLSSDGRVVAGQSADMVVTLWDANTRQELRRVPAVYNLAGISANNRWLVGVNRKVGLARWSMASGEMDGEPVDENRPNIPLGAVGDDRLVCFSRGQNGAPHVLRVWDFAQRRDISRWVFGPDKDGTTWDLYSPGATAVSGDGRLCAIALIAGRAQFAHWKLEIYELATQSVIFSSETGPHRITALAFNHDATALAVAMGDTVEIELLDLEKKTWRWKKTWGGQTDTLRFSPDDRLLAAGGREGVLGVFSSDTGSLVCEFRGQSGGIADVAWTPSSTLISGGSAGDVRHWNESALLVRRQLTGLWRPAGGGQKVIVSADGTLLAATDDPANGAIIARIADFSTVARVPGAWVPAGFDAKGEHILGVRGDGTFEKWRIGPAPEKVEARRLFEGAASIGTGVTISQDGSTLAAGTVTGELKIWNLAEGRTQRSASPYDSALWHVALSPDGAQAVSTGVGVRANAFFWVSREVERPLRFFVAGLRPLCTAFSPDGSRLAVGWNDGTVELRAARPDPARGIVAGRLMQRIRTDSSRIPALVFSPNGDRLFCGAPEGVVHVIATRDGGEIVTMRADGSDIAAEWTVSSLALSADGSVLAAYLNDGRVHVWRR